MLYLQKKYSLLTLLISLLIRMLIKTKSVLIVILWCAVVSLLPAQEIEHSQQIAISPYRGFVGVVITAKCSSESLGPGIDLSLQWLVKEGESNTTTALGGCEADNPGFQRMSCSASPALTGNALTGNAMANISVIEPYEQEPDYAVSTINYRTTATPTTMVCVLGNGDSGKTLEMTPDIAIEASIENLHMLCENGMSTLNWELKGSADHSQVNFNDGAGWRNTTLTSWPYTVTRADHRRYIEVRGVSDLYGLTPPAGIRLNTRSNVQVWQYSCSSYLFTFPEHGLKPLTYHLFMGDIEVGVVIPYDASQLVVDIPEQLKVPSYITGSDNFDPNIPIAPLVDTEIVITWGCYPLTGAEIRGTIFRSTAGSFWVSGTAILGPEQLNLGCLTNEEDNRASLPLNWIHQLAQEAQKLSPGGKPSIYHIVVAHEGYSEAYNATIDFADYPSNDNNRRLYSLPQSITLPLQKGNTYQVSITPDYQTGLLPESFCPAQTLTRNITIPANTPVKQLNETSVELQSMGRSSGFYVALFNQQNETAIAEYDDQNGNENLLMTDLALDQNYTAEIVYNGTDTIPCRSETIQFFLTAVPSPSYSELIAETTDTSMVFTSIAIPLSTSPDSAATSSMMSTSIPTPFPTSIPTAFEESTDPIQPASKDSPISLYIAGAIWSGVIVFAGILITINVCTSAKKK